MLSCTYQDGVSVGGVNLATRAEVQRLTDYTGNVGKQVYQDARASEAARDTAQEIAEGLSITVGHGHNGSAGQPGNRHPDTRQHAGGVADGHDHTEGRRGNRGHSPGLHLDTAPNL